MENKINVISGKQLVSDECWSQYPIKTRLWYYAKMVSNDTYEIHPEDKEEYSKLCHAIEKGKCIVLVGQPGSGKSTLTHIIQKITYPVNSTKRYKFATALNIAREFEAGGHDVIKKYTSGNWIIDDVGLEKSVQIKGFGSFFDVFELLIYEMCEAHYRGRCNFIISTNLSFRLDNNKFQERYGGRVISRVKQVCEVVKINGTDYRETKEPITIFPEVLFPIDEGKTERTEPPKDVKEALEKLNPKPSITESEPRDLSQQASDHFNKLWDEQGSKVNETQDRIIEYDGKVYTRSQFLKYCKELYEKK